MRIAIDVREAFRPKRAGKGQWTAGFLAELRTRDDVTVIPVVDADAIGAPSDALVIPGSGFRWHRNVAKWLRSERPVDLYVSPTSYVVPALLRGYFPCITVVHDLIAFHRGPHQWRAKFIERLLIRHALAFAARICTISEATRADLLSRFPMLIPERITSIFAGPQSIDPLPSHPDGKTILCVGTLCPRKNQLRLIKAFAKLPESLRQSRRLLLVGARGWQDEEIVELAKQTPGVEWRDYVDDKTYDELMSSCEVFAFPSFYEGFGLAVLDALQRGTPVLTSDRGSLKEVAGDAAVIVDPLDMDDIARGLEKILTDTHLRSVLVKKGPEQAAQYSWKKTVDLFMKSVQKISTYFAASEK